MPHKCGAWESNNICAIEAGSRGEKEIGGCRENEMYIGKRAPDASRRAGMMQPTKENFLPLGSQSRPGLVFGVWML